MTLDQQLGRDEALAPDRTLGDELLGKFQRLAFASVTRLTNDAQAPAYARLWADDTIVRVYQRFIDTAHRLNYFEEGGSRLKYLRDTDPEEHKRYHELDRAMRRKLSGAL